jgi:hypothetical protein
VSSNSRGEELEVGPASSGKLKQVWFSTNGMLLFAWFVLRGNHHHVRVWDVVDTKITGGLVYQVVSTSLAKAYTQLTLPSHQVNTQQHRSKP